jgi:hypothetical protein
MQSKASNIVSLDDARQARTRDRLMHHAQTGDTLVIETRKGLVRAEKIVCREFAAETLNSFGDYFILRYSDILDIRPVAAAAQFGAVTSHGHWAAPVPPRSRGASQVLSFTAPRRQA